MKTALTLAVVSGAGAASWFSSHRRSQVVQAWQPSEFEPEALGPLTGRAFGTGTHTTLVLHGLGATSDYWPKAYDTLGDRGRVVIPDLLGFGRSLDMDRNSFGLDDHLDALDACLETGAPGTETISVMAHSMGSGLGLAFASRHKKQITSVTCSGAPTYPDRESAGDAIDNSSVMARLFLLDPAWAKRACALNCKNRTLAGAFAALAEPSLPVAITRRASLHTWPAYSDSIEQLVLEFDWASHLKSLTDVPIRLIWGSEDSIGNVDYARSIASTAEIEVVTGQGHHLPITSPDQVLEQTFFSAD